MESKDKPREFIQLSNLSDKTGISTEWLQVWEEIEQWYGDPKKRETGHDFLKRMQSTYFIAPDLISRPRAIEELEGMKKDMEAKIKAIDISPNFSDDEKHMIKFGITMGIDSAKTAIDRIKNLK
jgi:hypothetical protein